MQLGKTRSWIVVTVLGLIVSIISIMAWLIHRRGPPESDHESHRELVESSASEPRSPSLAASPRQLEPVRVDDGIELAGHPGGVELQGVVTDINGGAVEGASVSAHRDVFGWTTRWVAVSDAEGRFTLWTARGSVALAVEADGYAAATRLALAPGPSADVVLIPESVIEGRVVSTVSGEPVDGVSVTVAGSASGISESTRSRDGGRFRLDQLEPDTYSLVARSEGFYGESVELVHLGLAEHLGDLTVEVHPAFAVAGRVVVMETDAGCDDGGVRLVDRSDDRNAVWARVGASSSGSRRNGGDGVVELGGVLPGVYQVVVHCHGFVPAPEYPDVVITDAGVTGLTWTVREGLAIDGEVVDSAGAPVAGVRVIATPVARPDDPRGQQTRGRSEPTGADGRFRVAGLLRGVYELAVDSSPDAGEQVSLDTVDAHDVRITLPPATTDAEPTDPVSAHTATLRGRVVDQHGSPAADVFVAYEPAAEGAASVLTDREGRFTIEGLDEQATYRVVAFQRGGAEAVADGVAVDQRITLRLLDTGELAGVVALPDGTPPSRFSLTVIEAEGLTRTHDVFRSRGKFRMRKLPPGRYTILVESGAGVARVDGVDLGPGQVIDDLAVVLTPRVVVRGRVVDASTKQGVPGMTVTIAPAGTRMRFAPETASDLARTTDADGRFEVAEAPTGRVRVSIEPRSAEGYAWQWLDIEIPASGEVVDVGELPIAAGPD